MKRFFLAFALVAAVITTAHAAERENEYADIHTVGVISVIGQQATLKNVGVMVFGNTEDIFNIDDWGIDDLVIKKISASLASRFAVKAVSYDKSTFAHPKHDFRALQDNSMEKLVKELPNTEGVDAWIVVSPASVQDPIIGTNQYLSGLGLYRHPSILHAIVGAYAFYEIDVIDAHTGKTIDYAHGSVGGSGLFPDWPIMGLAETVWSEKAAQMTDSQKAALKDALTQLMSTSLPFALSKAHLLDANAATSPTPSNEAPVAPQSQ